MRKTVLFLAAAFGLVAAGAAAALVAAPERLTLVAGEPPSREAPAPPPPDRADEVLAELDALRQAMRAFGEALDRAAEERDGLRAAAERAQADAARDRARTAESLAALDRAVAGVAQRVREEAAPAEPAPAPPEAVPEAAAAAPPEPPKRKSLAALLESRARTDVREERVLWRLLDGHCRVGFDGSSTIHNFTGYSDRASGTFHLKLDDPSDRADGAVAVDVGTIVSGIEDRDAEIRKNLSEDGSKQVRCELLGMEKREEGIVARLRFTCRGKAVAVEAPVTLEFTKHRVLHVKGQARLALSDFDIHPKAKLGLIKVADEVTVWWDLNAEADREAR